MAATGAPRPESLTNNKATRPHRTRTRKTRSEAMPWQWVLKAQQGSLLCPSTEDTSKAVGQTSATACPGNSDIQLVRAHPLCTVDSSQAANEG